MSQEVDLFRKAVKEKFRYQSHKGFVGVEDLYDYTVDQLDPIAINLEEEYKKSGEKSFVKKSSAKSQKLKDRLDVVVEIINEKLAEKEARDNALALKREEDKLLDKLAQKKEAALDNLSVEELEARLLAVRAAKA